MRLTIIFAFILLVACNSLSSDPATRMKQLSERFEDLDEYTIKYDLKLPYESGMSLNIRMGTFRKDGVNKFVVEAKMLGSSETMTVYEIDGRTFSCQKSGDEYNCDRGDTSDLDDFNLLTNSYINFEETGSDVEKKGTMKIAGRTCEIYTFTVKETDDIDFLYEIDGEVQYEVCLDKKTGATLSMQVFQVKYSDLFDEEKKEEHLSMVAFEYKTSTKKESVEMPVDFSFDAGAERNKIYIELTAFKDIKTSMTVKEGTQRYGYGISLDEVAPSQTMETKEIWVDQKKLETKLYTVEFSDNMYRVEVCGDKCQTSSTYGEPRCWKFDKSECQGLHSCNWDGYCANVNCRNLEQVDCEKRWKACDWTDGMCHPFSCYSLDEEECKQESRCKFTDYGKCSTKSCSDYGENECLEKGCTWNMNRCNTKNCYAIDEANCKDGCRWDGNMCRTAQILK